MLENDLTNYTSEEDFTVFKEECNNWIRKFQLNEWEVEYQHLLVEGCYAQCEYDYMSMSARLKLSVDWRERPITDIALRKTAMHEICELLLAKLVVLANSRFIDHDSIDSEIHSIIHRIQNIVLNGREKQIDDSTTD